LGQNRPAHRAGKQQRSAADTSFGRADPARMSNTASNGGREVANDHRYCRAAGSPRPDGWVLAVSVSCRSGPPGGRRAVSAALATSGGAGRGRRVRAAGDLAGVTASAIRSRRGTGQVAGYQRVFETVPVAPDETAARQLLDRRPRVLVRHLDLQQPRSARRRAGSFVSRLVSA
jgi:hypothetical protein